MHKHAHIAVPKLGLGFLKKLLFHKGFIKLIKSDRKYIYAFYVKTFVHAVLMNFLFNKIYIMVSTEILSSTAV